MPLILYVKHPYECAGSFTMQERGQVSENPARTRPSTSEWCLHQWTGQEVVMLWTLALILFVLWLIGTVSAYTMGGLIHALLVLALILVVLNLFTGTRRTV
jgi:hypothetical protein